MDITLPPDIEQALMEEANKRGTTAELLALDSLRARFAPRATADTAAGGYSTLADFLTGHIGVLHSSEQIPGGARMSEAGGEQFTAGLLKKRQQGHL